MKGLVAPEKLQFRQEGGDNWFAVGKVDVICLQLQINFDEL